ncbi:hypothetical protein K8F61_17205 [Microbacterium resistens]|uniref:Metallothionein n=1 Tax=Microbacterium resistens TaxID=156977 RepID=A0ABY3RQM1_9MICO|nr:hypothetical protein [Microbacterium resistens]UGS26342.1 hypothetical protein K8F61_17205 [Microbacterium resistens]
MNATAYRCECGTPITVERGYSACAHCDQPCNRRACQRCNRAGIKR